MQILSKINQFAAAITSRCHYGALQILHALPKLIEAKYILVQINYSTRNIQLFLNLCSGLWTIYIAITVKEHILFCYSWTYSTGLEDYAKNAKCEVFHTTLRWSNSGEK